ncbi:MAG TPA: tetratricopeptide repeat protein [Pyrinomonadaceae bacterium]|nr:tetratricopeptide repeat protein [Pyrinomonadaceae bacterium]
MKPTRFYGFITILAAALTAASCASEAHTEDSVQNADPAAVSAAISTAEDLFRQREDLDKLREAIRILGAARNPNRRNYEVEWKFAKFSYFLGKQTKDDGESERAFELGKQAGRIASRIEPGKPDGHFWFGANLGEQARKSPVTVGIKAVDDIREAMNTVIGIDPRYQGASAFDALAQVELSTTGMMGGKPEKAVEYLERALQFQNDNANVHLHLADAYAAVGRKPEGRRQLELLLKMSPNPEYAIEYREAAEQAKKRLETKF